MVRKHLEFSQNSIYLLPTILCFTIHYSSIGINFKARGETLQRFISTQKMSTAMKHENEAEKRHTQQLHT